MLKKELLIRNEHYPSPGSSRIVVACLDPNGETTNVALSSLGSMYYLWRRAIPISLGNEQESLRIEGTSCPDTA